MVPKDSNVRAGSLVYWHQQLNRNCIQIPRRFPGRACAAGAPARSGVFPRCGEISALQRPGRTPDRPTPACSRGNDAVNIAILFSVSAGRAEPVGLLGLGLESRRMVAEGHAARPPRSLGIAEKRLKPRLMWMNWDNFGVFVRAQTQNMPVFCVVSATSGPFPSVRRCQPFATHPCLH